jgi:hypothetical protein
MEPVNQNSFLSGTFLDSKYFDPTYLFNQGVIYIKHILAVVFSDQVIHTWNAILFFLAVFFVSVMSYAAIRMFEIRRKEHAYLHHEIEEYAHHKAEYEKHLHEQVGGSKNEHWGITLHYLFSQHSSDWKLAIIEADTMLLGLMEQLGFKGDTLGDKLKSANQDTFPNLTIAWEVHTIRNRIAHEGLAFELSHHEAKRVIALYEDIFQAYGYI